jgi:two-component system CheB/CheR fusion protein
VLIAVTGWGQAEAEQESLAAGFDAHMTKPVNLRKLASQVDELVKRSKQVRAA